MCLKSCQCSALCCACADGSFVYNVLTHTLVLQWACMLVPKVTVVYANVLSLAFPNGLIAELQSIMVV